MKGGLISDLGSTTNIKIKIEIIFTVFGYFAFTRQTIIKYGRLAAFGTQV
ncbi:MAG: hypothetical protein ACHQFW_07945 [Chitinophagales bacterium]